MKKNQIKKTSAVFVFLLLISCSLYSQTERNIKAAIKSSIANVILDNMSARECADINFATSSVVVLFSETGQIEKIIFSELPKCLTSKQMKMIEDLRKKLNLIGLSKSDFLNKFVLAVLIIRTLDQPQKRDVSFEATFNQIDEGLLLGKEAKYLISIGFELYPSIR